MPSTVRLLAVALGLVATGNWIRAAEPRGEHHGAPAHGAPPSHPQPVPVIHGRPPQPRRVNNQARVIAAPVLREQTGPVQGRVGREEILRGQVTAGHFARERGEERHVPRGSGPNIVEPSHSREIHVIQPYHPPRGYRYRYRVWVVGEFLPRPYWVRSYWVADYWDYGLEEPPAGCEWVRYGPDALLIYLQTGEVIEVVKRAFY